MVQQGYFASRDAMPVDEGPVLTSQITNPNREIVNEEHTVVPAHKLTGWTQVAVRVAPD